MSSGTEYERLFTLHGELGYFDLFQGQIRLPLMILGCSGFGKSELFHLLITQFSDEYCIFKPVASDGIEFQLNSRKNELTFRSTGRDVSIRGRDGVDWDRKIIYDIVFDKDYRIPLKEFKYGIILVGALGIKNRADYRAITKERGHRINFTAQTRLLRIKNPKRYLFELIQDMILKPTDWEQLVIGRKLKKIESEFRLITKISEFLPHRVLELTLPELENKWGQLNDVFKSLVFQMDRLIISSVEFRLSRMIRTKTTDLRHQIEQELRFSVDRHLQNLSGIPEILMIKKWLDSKIKQLGPDLKLPPAVSESIELGVLSIQTAFVEELGTVLKKSHTLKADELRKLLATHSIAISDLIDAFVDKGTVLPETIIRIKETEKSIYGIDQFLLDVDQGKI